MAERIWKLSPSDFAFLWEDCKRCFYLKVVHNFQRPRSAMPKIFSVIDIQMRSYFAGKRTSEVVPALPKGVAEYGEKWVQSVPIAVPSYSTKCFLKGKLDTVIRLDKGGYAVIDFKTSERKAEHIPLYSRQLHAYMYALQHAAPGNLALRPIKKLGLLVFEPNTFSGDKRASASLLGNLGWIEIQRDEKAFLRFLSQVLDVLEHPEPPAGEAACEWCKYRDTSRRTKL